jgi:hypothetical protein
LAENIFMILLLIGRLLVTKMVVLYDTDEVVLSQRYFKSNRSTKMADLSYAQPIAVFLFRQKM